MRCCALGLYGSRSTRLMTDATGACKDEFDCLLVPYNDEIVIMCSNYRRVRRLRPASSGDWGPELVVGGQALSKRSGMKLRVLQVGKFYPPHIGGMETHLQALCEGLRHHADLQVLVSSEGRHSVEEIVNSVSVARLSTWLTAFSTSISPSMVSCIRHSRADIVHIHLPNPSAVLAYLASGYRGCLIVTYHSDIVKQHVSARMFKPLASLCHATEKCRYQQRRRPTISRPRPCVKPFAIAAT